MVLGDPCERTPPTHTNTQGRDPQIENYCSQGFRVLFQKYLYTTAIIFLIMYNSNTSMSPGLISPIKNKGSNAEQIS